MKNTFLPTAAAILALACQEGGPAAQAPAAPDTFAPPQLLTAGGKEMGGTLLYPSPVLLDLDGDGRREMVIGGLRGYLHVTRRTAKGWGPESRLKARDGKDLKFHNW